MRKTLFNPRQSEKELLTKWRSAKDREEKGKIKKELIALYIRYGEYFKMSAEPNPKEAIKYLEQALKYDPFHPLANYRLAHLYYRDNNYGKAHYHFDIALNGGKLNSTQNYLAHLFTLECNAKSIDNSLKKLRLLENDINFEINSTIERYKEEIIIPPIHSIEKVYYVKKSNKEKKKIISEETVEELQINLPKKTILLTKEYSGNYIKFGATQPIKLEIIMFDILYYLVCTDEFLSNADLMENIERIQEDTIRRYISRLADRISYFHDIIEQTNIERKTVRRRKQTLDYIILSAPGLVLPDEHDD